jgi:triosephosphate isomerase
MRKKIVAGNWKMNLTKEQSLALVSEISKNVQNLSEDTDVIVSPSYVNLSSVVEGTGRNKKVQVAAQNMHFAENGAYTGEISAEMLESIGVTTVILGHSERREYFNEGAHLLTKKGNETL